MSTFIENELTKAERAWQPYRYLVLAILGLLLFSLGTCVGLKCAIDPPVESKSDTTHVVVASATAPHHPEPTSITYDDTASFTECTPLFTHSSSPAAPKSTGYYPAELRIGGNVDPGFLVPVQPAAMYPTVVPIGSLGWSLIDTSGYSNRHMIGVLDTPPAAVDSLAIYRAVLRDYRARVTYGDTLRFDTAGISGYVVHLDSLRYNRIQSQAWAYHFKLPVITNTVRARERGALYFGGLTQFDSRLNAGGPAASWKLPGGKVQIDGALLFEPDRLPQKQAGLKVRIGGKP